MTESQKDKRLLIGGGLCFFLVMIVGMTVTEMTNQTQTARTLSYTEMNKRKQAAWEAKMAKRTARPDVMQQAGRMIPKLRHIAMNSPSVACRATALNAATEAMRISNGDLKGFDPTWVSRTLTYIDTEIDGCMP